MTAPSWPSWVVRSVADCKADSDAVLVVGPVDRRSTTIADIALNWPGRVVEIDPSDSGELAPSDGQRPISLRDLPGIIDRVGIEAGARLVLDIGSLLLAEWATLLRAGREAQSELGALYSEPSSYRRSARTDPSQDLFDLSNRGPGVSPVPGFARLRGQRDVSTPLVALLGFEGRRLTYVMDQLAVTPDSLRPVVGRPGYRIEFVETALLSNRPQLRSRDAHRRLKFVPASCPFRVFELIAQICQDADGRVRVAPIGTEPHALGAVLFALENPACAELVYDHPAPRKQRSDGEVLCWYYDIAEFVAEESGTP